MKTSEKKDIRENAIQDQIARRAYELWEQDGYKHGQHAKHWEQAERQLFGTTPTPENPAYSAMATRDRITMENAGGDESVKPSTTFVPKKHAR
ncbi:MAG TPA: DUF2934 domain-containing protein [Rariglobus sp.]